MKKNVDSKNIEEQLSGGYSVCYNSWALDKRIRTELPLLMIISSLTAESGICFASNFYFAKLFNCTEISISQKINKLKRLGYIEIEYEKRGCEVVKRVIRLKKVLIDGYKKIKPTVKKIFKDNNTSNNNTRNNITPYTPLSEEGGGGRIFLISYFNQKQPEEVKKSELTRLSKWMDENRIDLDFLMEIVLFWIKNKDEYDYAPQVSSLGEMMVKFGGLVRFYENNSENDT